MAYCVRIHFVMQGRDEEPRQYWQKLGRDFSITKLKLKMMVRSDMCYSLSNSLKLGGFRSPTKAWRVQRFGGVFPHVYCRLSSLTQSLDFSNSFLLSISIKVSSLVPAVSQNTYGRASEDFSATHLVSSTMLRLEKDTTPIKTKSI